MCFSVCFARQFELHFTLGNVKEKAHTQTRKKIKHTQTPVKSLAVMVMMAAMAAATTTTTATTTTASVEMYLKAPKEQIHTSCF